MKKFTVLGMVLGSALVLTSCERTGAPGAVGRKGLRDNLPTVENARRKAEGMALVMVEVVESLKAAVPAGLASASSADLPTEITVRLENLSGESLELASGPSERVVTASGARTLSFARPAMGWGLNAAKSLENEHLRKLEQASAELQQWVQGMGTMAVEERLAFQQEWKQAAPRLRGLAERIIKSGPGSADLYGPALFKLMERVKTVSATPA